jgi:hypothetical protein
MILSLVFAAVVAADGIVWVSLPFVPPGTTGQRTLYAVSMPTTTSVLVEKYEPPPPVVPSFSIFQIQARPIIGTNRWCLGQSGSARVALLGRVTLRGVETIGGTPIWIRDQVGCGLAIALPDDTVSAHAVVVELDPVIARAVP